MPKLGCFTSGQQIAGRPSHPQWLSDLYMIVTLEPTLDMEVASIWPNYEMWNFFRSYVEIIPTSRFIPEWLTSYMRHKADGSKHSLVFWVSLSWVLVPSAAFTNWEATGCFLVLRFLSSNMGPIILITLTIVLVSGCSVLWRLGQVIHKP